MAKKRLCRRLQHFRSGRVYLKRSSQRFPPHPLFHSAGPRCFAAWFMQQLAVSQMGHDYK